MPSFPAFTITAAGLDMQAQAEAGGTLQFTRLAIGAGAAANPSAATDLVDERLTSDIQSFTLMGGGNVRARAVFTNEELETGFGMSEVGLFALDPTSHLERLYGYTKTTTPDLMPASGGPTILEEVLDAIISVGSASSVTAVVDDMVMVATKNDVHHPTNAVDLTSDPDTEIVATKQRVGTSYLDGVKLMGFGGLAIPVALGEVPTPPADELYLYLRTNGQASPNKQLKLCVKLPDGAEGVIYEGELS